MDIICEGRRGEAGRYYTSTSEIEILVFGFNEFLFIAFGHYIAEIFLVSNHITRPAKNPSFGVISLHGLTRPLIIRVLISMLLYTITTKTRG
jgi:chemotaxis signal transduction protein